MNSFILIMYRQRNPVFLLWFSIIILFFIISVILIYFFGIYGLLVALVLFVLIVLISDLDEYVYTTCSSLKSLDQKYKFKERINSDSRVVISLTTIPSRIDYINNTIKSLLAQTYRVDDIYIWLPEKSLKGQQYQIPEWLAELESVRIMRCSKDHGPATKLLYTLDREDLDTKIIVVDDDMIYKKNLVQKLIKGSQLYPNAAITTMGLYLNPDNDYATSHDIMDPKYTKVDRVMGMSGFLVKPRFFRDNYRHKPLDCFDYSQAPKEVIWVDDIWFSLHLKRRGVDVMRIPYGFKNIPIESPNFSGEKDILHIDHNCSLDNYVKTYQYFESIAGKEKKIKNKK